MSTLSVAFIGVGHMGTPMAANLLKAGYAVCAYDLNADLIAPLLEQGASTAVSIAACVAEADVVITMLPAGAQVLKVYTGEEGIFAHAKKQALLIESSTIDIATARQLHEQAKSLQYALLDAPVSGGTAGAAAGSLTFMVGGEKAVYELALPILEKMGKKIFYAGMGSAGQAAKICNNLLLGISMIGVCEAFNLADRLGLDAQTFYDIASAASGQCWALSSYCPVPGPLPSSPANRDYAPGFAVKMMYKDLGLAQEAAKEYQANTPLGAAAHMLYSQLMNQGLAEKDFSVVYPWLQAICPPHSR